MSWIKVKKFLRDNIVTLMKYPTKGDQWVDALDVSKDGKRLGICIAIDVASNALDPQIYADILDTLKIPITDARLAFGKAIKNRPNFIGITNFISNQMDDDDSYMRVMELSQFIEYYVKPNFPLTLAPSDIPLVKRMFFNVHRPPDLALIRKWVTGGNGRAWVMSSKEFQILTAGLGEKEKSTLINDALGLGIKKSLGRSSPPEMVAIVYPKNFSIGTYQPTTLDASWVRYGGFYVACGDVDTWGRTHSCSGHHKPISERIHAAFKGLTSDYQTLYIGVSDIPKENRNLLDDEALRRLDMVLKGLPLFI